MTTYSDQEIAQLIAEPKILCSDWNTKVQLRETRVCKTNDFEIEGTNRTKFRIILRQSRFNPLDFCIILGSYPTNSNKLFHLKLFHLKRYDGKSHEHTNPIEKVKFYDFHIHIATGRYQVYGNGEEDKYAEPTDRFTNYGEAFQCLLNDCGFCLPHNPQLNLF